VKNADIYMRHRHVMVVPLFSAGGMRVKIIEGMALGKAVISTPIGAEGIAYTEGKEHPDGATPRNSRSTCRPG
jgi:glycosyltransferase involved in cell wall biosynthesis